MHSLAWPHRTLATAEAPAQEKTQDIHIAQQRGTAPCIQYSQQMVIPQRRLYTIQVPPSIITLD